MTVGARCRRRLAFWARRDNVLRWAERSGRTVRCSWDGRGGSGRVDVAVSWAVVSYAFVVGMAATLNPCGAAMLPAYLSWYTGSEGSSSPAFRVPRAVAAGLAATVGFVVVFGAVGVVVTAGLGTVMQAAPYVGIAVGAVLISIGALTAVGRQIGAQLPGSARRLGGKGRGIRAMIGFGFSYGLASLGCALPVFLAGVTVAFTRDGVASGVGAFIAYALGMGTVLTALAVVIALAPRSRLARARAAGSRMQRPAGLLLVVVGGYIVYYWLVGGILGSRRGSGLLTAVDAVTARLSAVMTARLGVALAILVAVAAGATGAYRRWGNGRTLGTDSVDPLGDTAEVERGPTRRPLGSKIPVDAHRTR